MPLRTVSLLGASLVLGSIAPGADESMHAPPPPRLAVVISIDQCRGDFLKRFDEGFGDDGFRRLQRAGTDFQQCHYRHAATKTAVGHATMLTGANPNVTGIVGNEWLECDICKPVESIEDVDAPLVGHAPGVVPDRRDGCSPRRLIAETLGDVIKEQYGAQAKVFGVSIKDRAAILMAGKSADASYWNYETHMVTSDYYRKALPAWAETFNNERHAEAWFGKSWDRLLDPAIYDRIQGPDDAPGEYDGADLGRTFPHVLGVGEAKPGKVFRNAFANSPYSNDVLADFARALIAAEGLGLDDTPDLLCLSFSQPDTVGHNYGPDSHEVMDTYIRLDRTVAGLLGFLDTRVGPDRYVVVVTGDHGIAPLPEHTRRVSPDVPADRVRWDALEAVVNDALDATFGPAPWSAKWVVRENAGYRFQEATLKAREVDIAAAAETVRDTLLGQPAIAAAFTRAEILASTADDDSVEARVRRAFYDPRSPDVFLVLKPYYVDRPRTGTNHGTPWEYDTHVPLLWAGAGVPHGESEARVSVEDLAPTLARIMRVRVPKQATGRDLFAPVAPQGR